tara:strand:- start:2796 stop:3260 length:465 start_codon:yes stop_codon:yes gene_type:complete
MRIETHPHYESLNKKLLHESESVLYEWTNKTNVKAEMSRPDTLATYINQLCDWINTLFEQNTSCYNRWYARYDEEDYADVHCHLGAYMSFVYYVNAPEGSSPLVFPDINETFEAKEGKLVLFSGDTNHYVPANKCKNRVVVAGNIRQITNVIEY